MRKGSLCHMRTVAPDQYGWYMCSLIRELYCTIVCKKGLIDSLGASAAFRSDCADTYDDMDLHYPLLPFLMWPVAFNTPLFLSKTSNRLNRKIYHRRQMKEIHRKMYDFSDLYVLSIEIIDFI